MERFEITGGQPLTGTVRPAGNKNAALPMLAATLLGDTPSTLRNVPDIGDVRTMLRLIEALGALEHVALGLELLQQGVPHAAAGPGAHA